MQSSLMPHVDERGKPTGKKKRVRKPIGLWCFCTWAALRRKARWHRWSRYINTEQAEIVKAKMIRTLPSWEWHVGKNPPTE